MNKKLVIIISVCLILLIAGGVVAVLYVTKNTKKSPSTSSAVTYIPTKPSKQFSPDPSKQQAQTVADTSIDLGACTIVSTAAITTQLKPVMTSLQNANNRGVGHEANGDITQSCVYSLAASDTGNNRLTIAVTSFKDSANQSAAQAAYQGQTKVSDFSPTAYFSTIKNLPGTTQVSYIFDVLSTKKLTEFTITLPNSTKTFTEQNALAALTNLAKTVSTNSF